MLFYEYYVKTGDVPREMASIVKKLLDERQTAQYDISSNFTEEDVAEIIQLADKFLNFIINKFNQ